RLTAYGAVRHQADLRAGEAVMVVAAGGVGSNIIQIARACGVAQIIAVDVRAEKLEAARKVGATHVIDASQEEVAPAAMEITGGRAVDVACEALGRPAAVVLACG